MDRRLKFYGLNDYETFYQVKQATECLDGYDDSKTNYAINDIVELYNAMQFVENGVFPRDLSKLFRPSRRFTEPAICARQADASQTTIAK